MNPDRVRIALRILPFVVIAVLLAGGIRLLYGDGFGVLERTSRWALGTWDMWETPMVRPYETPMPHTPEGMVPVGGAEPDYAGARAQVDALPAEVRAEHSVQAYQRYCNHCHGPNGDGRIIVGESFPFTLPDLRSHPVQSKPVDELFATVSVGTALMIPLEGIVTPVDRVLALDHVHTLGDNPSVPFFAPRWVEPAERPGGPAD